MEGAFKKVKGQVTGQAENTITVLPKVGKPVIYSKRYVAMSIQKTKRESSGTKRPTTKKQSRRKNANGKELSKETFPPLWRELDKWAIGQPPTVEQEKQEAELEAMQDDVTRNEDREEVSEEECREERSQVEKEPKKASVPIKSEIKWEKEKMPIRSFARVVMKPKLLGNNVMVTNIEQESSVGESLPSVVEIGPHKRIINLELEEPQGNCTYSQPYVTGNRKKNTHSNITPFCRC